MTDETHRYTPREISVLRDRVEVLAGLHTALERWPEVASLTFASESPEALRDELSELLGIGTLPARAILDMQIRRGTTQQRDLIRIDLEESRAHLAKALEQLAD